MLRAERLPDQVQRALLVERFAAEGEQMPVDLEGGGRTNRDEQIRAFACDQFGQQGIQIHNDSFLRFVFRCGYTLLGSTALALASSEATTPRLTSCLRL